MRYLRSMVLAGLALVACAMFSVPSFAATTDPGLYAISAEPLDLAVLDEAIAAPDAIFVNQPQTADRDKQRRPGILKPVYAESFQSDGRSLRSYHRRC